MLYEPVLRSRALAAANAVVAGAPAYDVIIVGEPAAPDATFLRKRS